jgi:VWFA-related protein
MSHRAATVLAAFAIFTGVAQQNEPGNSRTVLRSTTQEVLLDFIARDKHQKLVTDLRAEDIEVLEDGVPQTVRSFQYRGGQDDPRGRMGQAPTHAGPSPASSPLREINLVSLVFEGLSPDTRRQATQAAKDFLANEVDQNTYIGVFTLNHRLALLQQYTNSINLLTQAVDRAATGAYQKFAKDIEVEVTKLNQLAGDSGQFQPIRPGSAEERGPVAADGGHAAFLQAERRMAAMTIEILSNQAGNLSIDALQQLIQAQAQLPGRKTVIYFSEGLIVPTEQPERLRAVVSAANRANIAFYTVDPSGLDTMSRARVAHLTTQAINSVDLGGSAVKATNYQENLRGLAEDTGGFAIADTNDTRIPLRHVMEEVRAHYEVAYAPTSSNYDGHFRTIEVRVHKSGIRLQSRKGYFALPMLDGMSIAPFELAALTALNSQPSPHAFEFHAGVLTFRATAQATECRVVFSVPSRILHFTEDPKAKLFRLHVAFLALLKDDRDQVVRKISRDLPFQAPADKRAEFERGEVTVTLPLRLSPGRYHLEAVAYDVDGDAASTRKIALVAPSAGALSDLVLVRTFEPAGEDRDATNPLESSAGKVTPEVSPTISKSNGAAAGIYFVLYPGQGASPTAGIAISRDGKLVSSARLSLPPAEADGSLRVLSRIPFSGFDPGVYEVTVTAAQGGATARRTVVIEVE